MYEAIRAAKGADLDSLEREPESTFRLAARVARHSGNAGQLLVAPARQALIGQVFVGLEEPVEASLREHLPNVALLQHLHVHPSHRRQGVGTRLLNAAEDFIRSGCHDRDRTRAVLGVNVDNLAPIRLYERLGYRDWGHGELRTFRVEHQADGSTVRLDEQCRVLVKEF